MFSTWNDLTWHEDSKDLTRRTGSDEILRDKAFNIAKNPKYDGYQRGLALVIYEFFDKKYSCGATENKIVAGKRIIRRIKQGNYKKIWKKKSTLIFYRQYLECLSSKCGTDKQI